MTPPIPPASRQQQSRRDGPGSEGWAPAPDLGTSREIGRAVAPFGNQVALQQAGLAALPPPPNPVLALVGEYEHLQVNVRVRVPPAAEALTAVVQLRTPYRLNGEGDKRKVTTGSSPAADEGHMATIGKASPSEVQSAVQAAVDEGRVLGQDESDGAFVGPASWAHRGVVTEEAKGAIAKQVLDYCQGRIGVDCSGFAYTAVKEERERLGLEPDWANGIDGTNTEWMIANLPVVSPPSSWRMFDLLLTSGSPGHVRVIAGIDEVTDYVRDLVSERLALGEKDRVWGVICGESHAGGSTLGQKGRSRSFGPEGSAYTVVERADGSLEFYQGTGYEPVSGDPAVRRPPLEAAASAPVSKAAEGGGVG